MCGRFNIIDDPMTQLLMEITGMTSDWHIDTSLNIAPTQTVPVLRYDDHWSITPMRWWLVPYWSPAPSTKYSMFNAKSETLATSRAFAGPFERRRCIVPVTGYYEWKKQGEVKAPYYIEPESDAGFAFAGLWDRWQKGDEIVESCTIITAAAPASIKWLHHRIPVHLTAEQSAAWVNQATSPDQLNRLLAAELRTSIKVTPVSTYVNNARNKDDRCLEPLGDPIIVH